jgi:3-methyladenine DNA glycosylase Tag
MEHTQQDVIARLESAATLLERTLAWIEERQTALTGEVEKISATVEQTRREAELQEKLAAAETGLAAAQTEIAELKAAASAHSTAPAAQRRTAAVSEMLAKHGLTGDGPVDVRALDAALFGLSLEQRIAVKSQLARAGAVA